MTAERDPSPAAETERDGQLSAEADGWYLYGICRRFDVEQTAFRGMVGRPVQALQFGELAAVVSSVSPRDFAPETLAERAADVAWLEGMVRAHNEVIAAVHAERTILPAKFGSVYAGTDDLRNALERMPDSLLAQLERLENADEWALHLYADRAAVREHAAAQDASVAALREEMATARPGRAYFLRQKLAGQIAAAADGALNRLAQTAFDHLATYARASQVSPTARKTAGEDLVEILRAAFLVPRSETDGFLQATSDLASQEGLGVETTGPWPPYSFAGTETGGAQ